MSDGINETSGSKNISPLLKIVVFGLSAGIGAALTLSTVVVILISTGKIKRDVFGRVHWQSKGSEFDMEKYERDKKIENSLRYHVTGHARNSTGMRVMIRAKNSSAEDYEGHVSFNIVFKKNDEVTAIEVGLAELSVKAGEEAEFISSVYSETVPDDFDEIVIVNN